MLCVVCVVCVYIFYESVLCAKTFASSLSSFVCRHRCCWSLSLSLSLALAPCSMYMTKLTWLWCCCCWCVRARPEPLAIRGSSQRCDNCIVDYVVVRFSQKKSTKYWLDKRKEFLAGRHHARCIHATHTTGFVTIKHTQLYDDIAVAHQFAFMRWASTVAKMWTPDKILPAKRATRRI